MICLYRTVLFEKNRFNEVPLCLNNTIPLRGILAVEIVLGHTYGVIHDNTLLYFNDRIGVWVVGLFFFLSGYGLGYNFHRKVNYLDKFICKRVGRILVPFFLMFIDRKSVV